MNLALACLATLAFLPPEDDKIWLKDGKVVAGEISERKTAYVEITVAGKKQRITREKIDRITDAQDRVRWIDAQETRTAHYTILSNAPKADVEALVRKLELFYAWFFQAYGKELKLHAAKRLGASFVDRKDEYLDAARKAIGGSPPQGFYSQAEETLFVCKQPIAGFEKPDETLFHEAGHQILHLCANLGSSDTERHWVHEAMACMFEGLKLDGDKLVNGLSEQRIRNLHIRMGRGDALRTLAALDRLKKEQYLAPEYDQGYALALFFLTSNAGKWRKPFLDYFQDIALTRVREGTFEKLFGRKIETFEAEWKEFVLGLKVPPGR